MMDQHIYTAIDEITTILFIIGILYGIYGWIKVRNRALDIEEFNTISNFDFKSSKHNIGTFLNDFITDCLQDYVLYNIVPDSNLDYINKDKEDEIRKGITDMVMTRLSDPIIKKITMCYSIDHFNVIIAEKIFVIVSIYVADFNMGHDKVSDVKKIKDKGKRKLDENDLELDW